MSTTTQLSSLLICSANYFGIKYSIYANRNKYLNIQIYLYNFASNILPYHNICIVFLYEYIQIFICNIFLIQWTFICIRTIICFRYIGYKYLWYSIPALIWEKSHQWQHIKYLESLIPCDRIKYCIELLNFCKYLENLKKNQ